MLISKSPKMFFSKWIYFHDPCNLHRV